MSYFFTYVLGDAIDERRARVLALMTLFFGGAVAQLGARLDGIEEVEGSNPFGSTKRDNFYFCFCRIYETGLSAASRPFPFLGSTVFPAAAMKSLGNSASAAKA